MYGSPPLYEGATLQLSLYYRDAASNIVTVAATTITNSAQLFPTNTHFVDFSVQLPGVLATDPWANQHIGVQIASTVGTNLASGYWDLDNVRLTETVLPHLANPQVTNNQFSFTVRSEPGLQFEILAHTNLASPLSNWTSLGIVTNLSGTTPFSDPATNLNRRFYTLQPVALGAALGDSSTMFRPHPRQSAPAVAKDGVFSARISASFGLRPSDLACEIPLEPSRRPTRASSASPSPRPSRSSSCWWSLPSSPSSRP